jgi:hypothetical protein
MTIRPPHRELVSSSASATDCRRSTRRSRKSRPADRVASSIAVPTHGIRRPRTDYGTTFSPKGANFGARDLHLSEQPVEPGPQRIDLEVQPRTAGP